MSGSSPTYSRSSRVRSGQKNSYTTAGLTVDIAALMQSRRDDDEVSTTLATPAFLPENA